jgi:tRNA(Ile)-lysidine synthase
MGSHAPPGTPSERPGGDLPALAAARASGLIAPGEPLLVLVSGGADSTCLLHVAVRLGASVSALHVNYGLRPEAGDDESHCRALAAQLQVPLVVEHVDLSSAGGPGNVQAEARAARYRLAERHAPERGAYAAAHTLDDQAETVLYRLAVSPGRRALLGMSPRSGRLVRPLLAASADDTRTYCRVHGLAWREDASNADPRFARSRIRHEVLPVLRELNPRVERVVAETSLLLRDEAEALERLVDEEVERAGGAALSLPELRSRPPALARLVLRRLAEAAGSFSPEEDGARVFLSRADADAILALAARGRGGTASLDLGGGLRAVVEYGYLRFTTVADPPVPEPVTLSVPGAVRFGSWRVEASPAVTARPAGPDEVPLDRGALGRDVRVRAWREGDRIRPAGLGGSKTLADLFTDAKVPRALRRSLPVAEAGGEVAWVAGLAVGERFRATEGADAVVLSARLES